MQTKGIYKGKTVKRQEDCTAARHFQISLEKMSQKLGARTEIADKKSARNKKKSLHILRNEPQNRVRFKNA